MKRLTQTYNKCLKMEQIDVIILRVVKGIANEKEQKFVESWRLENDENENLYRELKLVWLKTGRLATMKTFDTESALQRFHQSIGATSNKTKSHWIWLRQIAVLMLIPLLSIVIYKQFTTTENNKVANVIQKIVCPEGTQSSVTLADGSIVKMRSGATLSYPVDFNRTVQASGELYFKVHSDPSHPFIVNVDDVMVKVTGTQFGIKYDNTERLFEVILDEGRVELYDSKEKGNLKFLTKLQPGEKATYNLTKKHFTKGKVDASNTSYWWKPTLVFKNAKIDEVKKKVERWFGVEVKVVDSSKWKDYRLSARVNDETLEEFLQIIELMGEITYSIKTDINSRKQVVIEMK
ncbi:MAG: FecR family protein [Carboxylicivirga sp.]|nr:FecR family protein [Carboxylicivirga sp.]